MKPSLPMAVNGNFYPVSSSVCFFEVQCWGVPLTCITLFIFLSMLSKLQRMPLVIFCFSLRLWPQNMIMFLLLSVLIFRIQFELPFKRIITFCVVFVYLHTNN